MTPTDPAAKADAVDRAKRTAAQGLGATIVLELGRIMLAAVDSAGDVTLVDWDATARSMATAFVMVALAYLMRSAEG